MCLPENLRFLLLESLRSLQMEKSIRIFQLGQEEQGQGHQFLVECESK